jgi:hypothetical protein
MPSEFEVAMTNSLPWLRLYRNRIDDRRYMAMGPELIGWHNLLSMIAGEKTGALPDIADAAHALRMPEAEIAAAIDRLCNAGELKRRGKTVFVAGWEAVAKAGDRSNERVKKHRLRKRLAASADAEMKRDCNVTGNDDVTPKIEIQITDTEGEEDARRREPPSHGLDNHDSEFEAFWAAYPKQPGDRRTAAAIQFEAARAACQLPDHKALLAAVEAWKRARAKVAKPPFAPAASKWLLERGWREWLPAEVVTVRDWGDTNAAWRAAKAEINPGHWSAWFAKATPSEADVREIEVDSTMARDWIERSYGRVLRQHGLSVVLKAKAAA